MKVKILPRKTTDQNMNPIIGWNHTNNNKLWLQVYYDKKGIILKWADGDRFYRVDWDNFYRNFVRSL